MAAAVTKVKMEDLVDDVEVEDNTIPVDKDEFKVDVHNIKYEPEEVKDCDFDETQPSTSSSGVVKVKEEQLGELDCDSDDSNSMDINEFKEEPPEDDEEMLSEEDDDADPNLTEDLDLKFEATEETLQDANGCANGLKSSKRRRIKYRLTISEKKKVLNIYNNELLEAPEKRVTNIVEQVAKKTGVSRASVFNIIRASKQNGKFSAQNSNQTRKNNIDSVDDFSRNAIRRTIHEFFFRNEFPTIDKVLNVVNEAPDLPNFKRRTFYKLLKKLSFKYECRDKNSVLFDKDEMVLWRRGYLKNIKLYRNQNRKIYYLLSGLSTGLKSSSGKGKRLIICHIGGDDGFLPDALWAYEVKTTGDCHEEIVAKSFENWFGKILPKLADNAVIVFDNAPYQARKLEKIPTFASKKADIQNWLTSKNISFENDFLKAELLRIVNQHRQTFNKYVVDEMAIKRNKIVLRLPPYHGELNPTDLIWKQIKNYVASKNPSLKVAYCKRIFYEAAQTVTKEKWQKCILHVREKLETRMWLLDNIIEDNIQSNNINVNQSESSSEFSD